MLKRATVFALYMVLILGITIYANAQDKTIVFVSVPEKTDPLTGEHADKPFIDDLIARGYEVITFYNTALELAPQASLDTLNNADLVIIGRSTASTDFQPPHREAWNTVTAPMLLLQLWCARSSRLNWFNSDQCTHYNDIGVVMDAFIEEPGDPIFEGFTTEEIPWCTGAYDVIEADDSGNGLLLASSVPDGYVQFVRFEEGEEFYGGAGDFPAGPRTFIGNGNDNLRTDAGEYIYYYYNFTDESKEIYFREVDRMAGRTTDVEDYGNKDSAPVNYGLFQNYPNPFNPTTTITFALGKSDRTTIQVFNVMGQLVETLIDGKLEAGIHQVVFQAEKLNSGIYYYSIHSGDFTQVREMVLLK
jgi:hypothetical protein